MDYYLDNWLLCTTWTSLRIKDLSSIDINPWCRNSKDIPWNQEISITKNRYCYFILNRIIEYAIKNKNKIHNNHKY